MEVVKKVDGDARVETNATQARSGVTGHGVRYVLIFGLLGAVVAMALALKVFL